MTPRDASIEIKRLVDTTNNRWSISLSGFGVTTLTTNVLLRAITLAIEELGQGRVGGASDAPRLVDWHTIEPTTFGAQPVHATVEISEDKLVLGHKSNHARFPPIRTSPRPLDENPSAPLQSIFGNNFESLPNAMKLIPMFPNTLTTTFSLVPIDMHPGRTTGTWTGKPDSVERTIDVRLANDNSSNGSKVDFLSDPKYYTTTRPPRRP